MYTRSKVDNSKREFLFINDNFASLEKIDPLDEEISNIDRDLYFKFYFKVSQTKAIKENAFSVVVTVKTSNAPSSTILQGAIGDNSDRLINSILTNGSAVSQRNNAESRSTLLEKIADITSKIDNSYLTALKNNIVDESQFAKTKILVKAKTFIPPNSIENSNSSVTAPRIASSTLESDHMQGRLKTKSDALKQSFKLLNLSISPSSITYTSDKVLSNYSLLNGTSPARNNFRNSLLDFLSFIHITDDRSLTAIKGGVKKNDFETVIEQKFDDLINVNLDVILKESYMYRENLFVEFKLVKRIINSKNQIQQVVVEAVQKKLDMKYYYDNFLSKNQSLSVGVSRTNQQVMLQIKNNNGSSSKASVYAKKINYFNITNYIFAGGVSLGSRNQIKNLKINDEENDAIYRIVSTNVKTSKMSSEFIDVVVRNPRRNYVTNVVTIPELLGGKVYLTVIDNSREPGIVGCKIFYKNLTKKEKKYSLSSFTGYQDFRDKKEIFFPFLENLIPYNTYEITAKAVFENGIELYSSQSSVIQAIPYLGSLITFKISNVASSDNDVTFNLSAEQLPDQTSQITDLLGQVSGRYNSDYYLTKGAEFDKFIAFQVFRYDTFFGEFDDLGIITNNQTFSDQSQSASRNASKLASGNTYKYIIYPLIRDPETITETNKTLIDQETKKSYASNVRKFRHPEALMRGSILSNSRINKDSTHDMLYGTLGDSKSIKVTFGKQKNAKIQDFLVTFFNNKRLNLSWKIIGDQSFFDHILVFKEYNGVKTLIGKTHTFLTNVDFYYDLTKNDIGNVRFILTPVHKDYEIGSSIISEYVLIEDIE